MEVQNAIPIDDSLRRNNASVSYFQNVFGFYGVLPQTSAGVPFLDPCSGVGSNLQVGAEKNLMYPHFSIVPPT